MPSKCQCAKAETYSNDVPGLLGAIVEVYSLILFVYKYNIMSRLHVEREALKALGQKIKEVRVFKKFSQMKLAALSDSEKSNISRLESGNVNPTFLTLKRIADILKVAVVDLIP